MSLLPNCAGVTGDRVSLACPHCRAELDVRVEVKAAVVSPLRLRFESRTAFERWLRASGMSLDEFETLPVYQWYRDELEPFVRAARDARDVATPQTAQGPALDLEPRA